MSGEILLLDLLICAVAVPKIGGSRKTSLARVLEGVVVREERWMIVGLRRSREDFLIDPDQSLVPLRVVRAKAFPSDER